MRRPRLWKSGSDTAFVLVDDRQKWQVISYKVYERKLVDLYRRLRELELDPILIKGWAAGLLYPAGWHRPPGDFDLVFDPASLKSASDLSFELAGFPVDIHKGMRKLDTVAFEQLYSNSRRLELEDVRIRILRPEDHLRVLCVHWLVDGGERKDRLYDIYWAVTNRGEEFNWEECLGPVSERRRRWIICTIGLAHRYLDLDISGLPFENQALDLPSWLTRSVEKNWNKGVPHVPIHWTLKDPKALKDQIRKRFPPDELMATVEMEGDFDSLTRLHYRVAYLFRQAGPSLVRIARTVAGR